MALGEKDVTVTIKVKDNDVTAAEAKLKRLKAAANDVGTPKANLSQGDKLNNFLSQFDAKLNNLKNSAKPAEEAINGVTEAASGTGEAAAAAGISIGAMAAAAAVAVLALVALLAITEKVAEHIYADVQAFVKYGLQIGQMTDDTGLATETVSALNAELEAQGKSFNDINGPINEFRKTIGQAAAGSEDARAKLQLLGIDGSKAIYDIDGAFKTVIATIVRTTNPLDQARLGFAAFGSEWVKLQPIIRDFPGDVNAVIRKAQELGIVMSGNDVKSAKDLERTMSDLQNTIKGIETTLGREFLPVVRDVAKEIQNFVTKHREGILSLAETFGGAAVRIINAFEAIVKWIDDHPTLVGVLGKFFDYALHGPGALALPTSSTPAIPRQPQGPQLYDYTRPQDHAPDLAALDAKRAQEEKEMKDAIERNKKDWDAAIKLWEDSGNEAGTTLTRIFGDLKDKLEKDGNIGDFIKGVNAATGGYLSTINQVYTQLEQLEDERARRNKATDNEMKLLENDQLKRRQDWANKIRDIQKQADDLVTKDQKKALDQQLKDFADAISRKDQLDAARTATAVANAKLQFDIGAKGEKEYIDFVNAQELGDARLRLQRAEEYLGKVKGNKAEEAKAELQVGLAKEHVAQTEIANGERTLDYDKRRLEAAEKLKKAYEDLRDSLQDQLDELLRNGKPLSEYEKTVRDLERDYKDLDPAQKQNLENIAAEIDAVKELQGEYKRSKVR
jgi:hypothetical protein